MRKKICAAVAGTALALSLLACDPHIGGSPRHDESSQPVNKSQVDFATVSASVFTPRCISCHSQYGSYVNVRRELGAIVASIDANRMPKTGGPLSDDLKKLVRGWAAAGAPEKASEPGEKLPPEELLPIWSSVFNNVIAPKCLVCHNPQGQAKFLDLSTRQAIFSARDRVFFDGSKLLNFDAPEASYLVQIVQDEFEPMPPSNTNIPRLTEEEVAVLTEWIGSGLP